MLPPLLSRTIPSPSPPPTTRCSSWPGSPPRAAPSPRCLPPPSRRWQVGCHVWLPQAGRRAVRSGGTIHTGAPPPCPPRNPSAATASEISWLPAIALTPPTSPLHPNRPLQAGAGRGLTLAPTTSACPTGSPPTSPSPSTWARRWSCSPPTAWPATRVPGEAPGSDAPRPGLQRGLQEQKVGLASMQQLLSCCISMQAGGDWGRHGAWPCLRQQVCRRERAELAATHACFSPSVSLHLPCCLQAPAVRGSSQCPRGSPAQPPARSSAATRTCWKRRRHGRNRFGSGGGAGRCPVMCKQRMQRMRLWHVHAPG